MRSIITITVAVCLTLMTTVSCREELFELVGDHDISVEYSNSNVFSTISPFWVRDYSGGIEFNDPAYPDYFFRITNISDSVIEINNVYWGGSAIPMSMSFALVPLPPVFIVPGGLNTDLIINYPFTGDDEGVLVIKYVSGGDTRNYYIRVEGHI